MKKFLQEFKEFAIKGNIFDMAVGVIIGGAFGKIVSSLVGDILMPLISILLGSVSFESMKWVLGTNADGTPNTLNYGLFLQNIVDFLIIALSIFLAIKLLAKLKRREDAPKEKPEEKPDEQTLLLREIRDLLMNYPDTKEQTVLQEPANTHLSQPELSQPNSDK